MAVFITLYKVSPTSTSRKISQFFLVCFLPKSLQPSHLLLPCHFQGGGTPTRKILLFSPRCNANLKEEAMVETVTKTLGLF